MRSEAEKKLRAGRIGSTDIAAILGMHPSRTPIEVFRAVRDGWDGELNEQMRIGDALEPYILDAYGRKTGRKIVRGGPVLHPTLPTVATPDAIASDPSAGRDIALEAKSVIGWQAQEYGEGTDEVPQHHIIQGTWHLAHLRAAGFDIDTVHFPVLIGGCAPIRIYEVKWDAGLADNLLAKAAEWHRRHIITGVPPEVDGSPAYTQFLADHWEQKAPLRDATPEEAELARALKIRCATLAEYAAKVEENKNRLRASIGDAEGIKGDGFRITWKARKDGVRVFKTKFDGEEA